MWILVIVFFNVHGVPASALSIPGYASEEECITAANCSEYES
jgi:hypothetical protein